MTTHVERVIFDIYHPYRWIVVEYDLALSEYGVVVSKHRFKWAAYLQRWLIEHG